MTSALSARETDCAASSRWRSAAGTLRGVIVQVPDAHAATDEVRAAGATVVREDYDTPFGHFVEIEDPDGNGIALWEPASGMDIAAITG